MDDSLYREQIAALLADENRELSRLQSLLETEYEAIQRNDLSDLEHRGALRAQSTSALMRVQEERRSMLNLLGLPVSNEGLEQLLRRCDPQGTLGNAWRQCAELASRCRELNDRNGMAVSARLRRVEGMLEVITARPPAATYERDASLSMAGAGRLLSAEA